ncbi:MAG: DUF371 domain-containing protein [Ignisphaera sp.]
MASSLGTLLDTLIASPRYYIYGVSMNYIPVYRDRVVAKGHKNIKALHPTTFELTKDNYLTERGDCIIGINLDKSASELDPKIRELLKKDTSIVLIVLKVDDVTDIVIAQGSKNLVLNDPRKIVVRRSSYIDSATVAINANKGSKHIKRDLIERLKSQDATLVMDIYVLDLETIDIL